MPERDEPRLVSDSKEVGVALMNRCPERRSSFNGYSESRSTKVTLHPNGRFGVFLRLAPKKLTKRPVHVAPDACGFSSLATSAGSSATLFPAEVSVDACCSSTNA